MKYTTHVILVSAQAVPNLTPLLDDAIKPTRVIMVVSPDMQIRADWLESVIRPKGIKTERWHIPDPWDIAQIRDVILESFNPDENPSIALNATGGTKPMSIAAYEVFRAFQQPIFYIHPQKDLLVWMYPEQQPIHKLADRIKLKDFLRAHGATEINRGPHYGVKEELRELTQILIANTQLFASALSILNAYAANAAATLQITIDNKHQRYRELFELIDLFINQQLVTLTGNQLRFKDEAARFYINGGWLEEHVYGLCLNLKKDYGIQDIARSLEVERSFKKQPVSNEMDVVFLKNNTLYLIECKTHYDKNQTNSKNTQALYKLDSLKELMGGLQAKTMLVNFNPLNDYDLRRAGDLNIHVCAGNQLPQLSQQLQEWIKL